MAPHVLVGPDGGRADLQRAFRLTEGPLGPSHPLVAFGHSGSISIRVGQRHEPAVLTRAGVDGSLLGLLGFRVNAQVAAVAADVTRAAFFGRVPQGATAPCLLGWWLTRTTMALSHAAISIPQLSGLAPRLQGRTEHCDAGLLRARGRVAMPRPRRGTGTLFFRGGGLAMFRSPGNGHLGEAFELLRSSLTGEYVTLRKRRFHVVSIGEGSHVWILRSGWAMAVRGSPQGRMKGVGMFGPGDIVGVSGLGGVSRDVTLYALSDVVAKRGRTEDLTRAMKEDPRVCEYVVKYVCRRYAELLDEMERSTLCALDERVRAFETGLGIAPGSVRGSLSEQVIAWAVGAHPVSICRVLTRRYGVARSRKARMTRVGADGTTGRARSVGD